MRYARTVVPGPPDIDTLSEAELEALQTDADGRRLERNVAAERWYIGSIIATVVLLAVIGLIGMAKGAAEARRAVESGRGTAGYVADEGTIEGR